METDPVCQMRLEPQQAAAHAEHAGATYYFCSESCHQKFAAHPEKYASKKSSGEHGGHTHGHG